MIIRTPLYLIKNTLLTLVTYSLLLSCEPKKEQFVSLNGNVFGTTFLIKYKDPKHRNFKHQITTIFNEFNNSMSTYHKNSTISQLNNGAQTIEVNSYFESVFLLSKNVFQKTNGYFDPTIGKMVNAWGFGPKKLKTTPNYKQIDSLMQYIGFDKVSLNHHIIFKKHPETILDFNAIAKGYGVDLVGLFLEKNNITNYLVEIGGEIRARGKNPNNKFWSVGIEEPNFDGTRSLQKVITLNNQSIATSGNYRKYKIDSITGKKYAHTLNPKTGYPAKTNLLSTSVISQNTCGEADAYATAFMAMGFNKAKEVALKIPELKVIFIYSEETNLKVYSNLQ